MKINEFELLNKLYQNASMGITALSTVIPKTQNTKLKSELETQLKSYQQQSQQIKKKFTELNVKPKDINPVGKISVDASIIMHTSMNNSASHIAEMVIKGSNMGIIDINKKLNDIKTGDSGIIAHAEEILKCEQQYIDKLKSYL